MSDSEGGRCYEITFKALCCGPLFFRYAEEPEASALALQILALGGMAGHGVKLCHGWPTLTGGPYTGAVYGHAWIEIGSLVLDPGSEKPIPKEMYYRIGKIDQETVATYSKTEAYLKMMETDTLGPWHEPPPGVSPLFSGVSDST